MIKINGKQVSWLRRYPNCATWNIFRHFGLSWFYLGLFFVCFAVNLIMGVKNAFSIGFIQSIVFFAGFLVLHWATKPVDKPQ